GQAGGADAAGHHRDPHAVPDLPAAPAVLRPRPGAPARAPADRHHGRHPDDLRHGLPHLRRRAGRVAERDRPEGAQAGRGGEAGGRAVGLPRLPQVRRERKRRSRPQPDQDRRSTAEGGARADAAQPHVADAALRQPAAGEVQRAGELPRPDEVALAGVPVASQTGTLEEGQVRAMFDRIAGVYDRMNAVMTAGLDRRWRARAADLAAVGPGDRVLDVATGTRDLALELAGRVAPGGEVVGSDFAEAMLKRAREKAAGRPDVRFEWGDALALAHPDAA